MKQKWQDPKWVRLFINICQRKLPTHFNEYIIENTNFKDYCGITVGFGSNHEQWLKLFCQLQQDDKEKVDDFCQDLVSYIVKTYQRTCVYAKSNNVAIFWNLLHQDMISDGSNNFYDNVRIKKLPHLLQNNKTCLYILTEIMVKVVEEWLSHDLMEFVRYDSNCNDTNLSIELTENMMNEEISMFVGFGLSSRIRLLKSELVRNRTYKNKILIDNKKKKLHVFKK